MPTDKETLRFAFRQLASARISREEKLRRIDLFLGGVRQTEWDSVFSIIKEEKLGIGLFTLADLLVLFVRLKDYKGLHQLKNRMYLIANQMPFLFAIDWRKFPIGTRQKGNRSFRPSGINPWPNDFFGIIGSFSKKNAIKLRDVSGTTLVERGAHFSSVASNTIEKMSAYPNLTRHLLRHINEIVREKNGSVEREVQRLKEEMRPSYGSLCMSLPDDLIQILGNRTGFNYCTIEQVVKVILSCSQSEEEGKPVDMGILMRGKRSVEQFFESRSADSPSNELYLREEDWPKIRKEISRTADGRVAALVVNGGNGRLSDVRLLPRNKDGDFYCLVTHPLNSDAVAFLVGQFSIRVYYDGDFRYQLILNRKYGRWEYRDLGQISAEVEKKAAPNSIKPRLLSSIVRIGAKISEEREGAIAIISDVEPIGRYLLQASIDRIAKTRKKLASEMSDDEIIGLMREDGAILFSRAGQFQGSQLRFNGPGGRHEIARYITEKCAGSIAMVVSHDSTITIFQEGRTFIEF